jgi:uncharacterized membrane protein
MTQETTPRFWITLITVAVLLIFLYFYQPFERYLIEQIPLIRFANVIFWFASLVGIIGYVVAHWQSFRRHIFENGSLGAEALIFDSLQIAILVAVIFAAGATLQAVVKLGEHLVQGGGIIDGDFGMKLLAVILLVILAILFVLLHHVVRMFRHGMAERRPLSGISRSQPPGR